MGKRFDKKGQKVMYINLELLQKKWKRALLVLPGVLLFSLGTVSSVNATDLSAFSVRAEIPENQLDRTLSYFDLRMEPGQEQIIEIEISNDSDKDIHTIVCVNNASTGRNGTIAYSVGEIKDESMVTCAEEIAAVLTPEKLVKANSTERVQIKLTMPETEFDGTVLGGIYVTVDDEKETAANNEENNIQIHNRLAYVLGLKLTENDQEITPNLNLKSIKPVVSALRTAVAVNLQNSEPLIMKGMTIDAQIYQKGGLEPIRTFVVDYAEAAPNSNFDVVIDWEGSKIEPGEYRLKMKAEYETYIWEWDELFTIEQEASESVNESAEDFRGAAQQTVIWPFITIGVLLFIVILLLILLLVKRSKETKREQSSNEK